MSSTADRIASRTLHNLTTDGDERGGRPAPLPGAAGEASLVVTPAETAAGVGNDAEIVVLSTPHLLLLVEAACYAAVKSSLDDGERLVGAAVRLKHLAPTPVGERVTARATLVEVDGARLVFDVTVDDEHERVGEARMEHYAVDLARFRRRIARKRGRNGEGSPRP